MLAYTKLKIKRALTKTFASLFNETRPILVTLFLGNKWWHISKKTFACPFLAHRRKKEEQNRKQIIANLFAFTHKRNNIFQEWRRKKKKIGKRSYFQKAGKISELLAGKVNGNVLHENIQEEIFLAWPRTAVSVHTWQWDIKRQNHVSNRKKRHRKYILEYDVSTTGKHVFL